MQGCRPALFGKKLHHAAVKIGGLLIGGMAKPFIEIQFAVFDLAGKFHRGGGTDDFVAAAANEKRLAGDAV